MVIPESLLDVLRQGDWNGEKRMVWYIVMGFNVWSIWEARNKMFFFCKIKCYAGKYAYVVVSTIQIRSYHWLQAKWFFYLQKKMSMSQWIESPWLMFG